VFRVSWWCLAELSVLQGFSYDRASDIFKNFFGTPYAMNNTHTHTNTARFAREGEEAEFSSSHVQESSSSQSPSTSPIVSTSSSSTTRFVEMKREGWVAYACIYVCKRRVCGCGCAGGGGHTAFTRTCIHTPSRARTHSLSHTNKHTHTGSTDERGRSVMVKVTRITRADGTVEVTRS
jgi:hypothetical protein